MVKLAAALLIFAACISNPTESLMAAQDKKDDAKKSEVITLGAGCFWCVEAVFQEVKGVTAVESGYSNGSVEKPTYEEVCTGKTGCAEVCKITFNPDVVSFKEILAVFFKTHDPTTLNSQGNDHGTQYRSGIYYHTEEQKKVAEQIKKELGESGAWKNPIVTEILAVSKYSKAEEYHQNYFRRNPNQGYCRFVIAPKMEKFRKVFPDKLQK